jgi:hypothetical protein
LDGLAGAGPFIRKETPKMAIQYIDKKYGATSSTAIANDATGRAKVQSFPDAAGIAYDLVDNTFKFNGSGTVKSLADSSGLVDVNAQARLVINPTAKTISDGAATALFSVAVPASTMIGGSATFLVRASDGTDFQTIAGIFTYSAEAKATVVVGAITYVAANEAKSVSAGTLTLAFTADVSVANVVTYKLQPTGSLTETTPYTVEYTLLPIRGTVTIL